MELVEPTWGRVIRVWWGLLWRALVAGLLGAVAGAVAGFFVGGILGMMHVPIGTIRIVCGIVGFLLGLPISLIPIRWVLGKKFGDFRLVLVSTTASTAVG